jgi:hypothetical protein
MADIDEELKAGLTQAKKKARNYVLIAKGSTAVKLIVQKKPIKAGDVMKAKTEAKGNTVVEGTCIGDGTDMVFQVVGEEPSIKTLTIKELIAEQTELTMKPRFQIVTELAKVLEDDGDENKIPDAPPPPQQQQQQGPATVSAADEDLLMALINAMGKLGPRIQEAIKKFPDRREFLVGEVGKFQKSVKAKDVEPAKAAFKVVSDEVTKLLGQAPTPTTTPPTKAPEKEADPKAAQWEKEWADLEPEYLAALKTASSEVASQLRVVHAYAFEQAEATQYDKALAALGRLKPLLAKAVQGKGAAGEVAEGTVEKRSYMIERIQKLPMELRPEVDKLKAAIATNVQNENPDELAAKIEESLQAYFDEIQKEIDAAINKGNMKVLDGMSNRILAEPLLAHLVSNPMTQGKAFAEIIKKALGDIEEKLKA